MWIKLGICKDESVELCLKKDVKEARPLQLTMHTLVKDEIHSLVEENVLTPIKTSGWLHLLYQS